MCDPTVEQYNKKGFAIVSQLFSPTTIEQLRTQMLACFSQVADFKHGHGADQDLSDLALLRGLFEDNFQAYLGAAKICNYLPLLYQLAVSKQLLVMLKKLNVTVPALAARPLVWFHHPSLASSSSYERLPAHQEWSNMQGSLTGAVVWSSLVPIDMDIGPLEIIPGSHKTGLARIAGRKNLNYPLAIDIALEDRRFVPVTVQPGDALIFHPLLIHRSGINQSNRIRWTFNFRFNNVADPIFIKRHYPNPFHYQAPTSLPEDEYTITLLEKFDEYATV